MKWYLFNSEYQSKKALFFRKVKDRAFLGKIK